MMSDAQQRKIQAGSSYLHQLTLALHRFVTTPDDGNLEMLSELAKQYQQAAHSGSIECPRIF